MKNNILITMGILVLLGIAVQGLFGIVAGVFLSAILGIIYGAVKKNKQFLRWSVIALTIDIICIILFYFCHQIPYRPTKSYRIILKCQILFPHRFHMKKNLSL